MHKIKDTSTASLQPDACIPDYTCSDRYMCQLKRSIRDAKKIVLPEFIQHSKKRRIHSLV